MNEKTVIEMHVRFSVLQGIQARNELSLRTAGELDSIVNHGIDGWKEWTRKNEQRRENNRRNRFARKIRPALHEKKGNK